MMRWARALRPLQSQQRSLNPFIIRTFAVKAAPTGMTEGELHIFNLLNDKLDPGSLAVQDVSGGCGEFYHVQVSSKAFKGMPMIKQHRLVQQILKEEIKGFHGIQLQTSIESD